MFYRLFRKSDTATHAVSSLKSAHLQRYMCIRFFAFFVGNLSETHIFLFESLFFSFSSSYILRLLPMEHEKLFYMDKGNYQNRLLEDYILFSLCLHIPANPDRALEKIVQMARNTKPKAFSRSRTNVRRVRFIFIPTISAGE